MKPLNIVTPSLVLIIIALSFFWWGTCKSAKVDRLKAENESRISRERIQELDRQAKTAGHRADSLTASFVRRRTSDSLALTALKMRNKGMSENVHILREPVQPLIDSIQALAQFVRAYDSLLAGKDEEIKQLELRHEGQIVDLTEALKERGNQIMAEQAKSDLWRQSAESSQKQVRKLQRGKVFRNVVIGVLTGGIVYLSLRE